MTTPRSSPTETKPTHDITLSDGVTTLGLRLCDARGNPDPRGMVETALPRQALQIRQGQQGYDDQEYPYSPIVQSDWSGGRGQLDFERSTARYYDANRIDALGDGRLILGGLETYTTGYYSSTGTATRDSTRAAGSTTNLYLIASSVTPSANISVRRLRFWLSDTASASATLRAAIYSDSSGPNTQTVISDYVTVTLTTTAKAVDFEIAETALTASTKYWVVLEIAAGCTITVGRVGTASGNAIWVKDGADAWGSVASNTCIAFTLYTAASGFAHFFEYKGALYAVTKPDDFTTPKLFINGYRGAATSNSADKTKLNTSLNLSGVDLTGKIALIIGGPGSREEYPWRVITGNTSTGTNDSITVGKAWKITHTTSTLFVILGCDTWTEITGHGLTKPVTDVCVSDNVVYFAQGDEAYMRRMNYSTSGSYAYAADGTNYAQYLLFLVDEYGKKYVWRTRATTNDVSRCLAKAWGTNLTFGTAISCGQENERITGIVGYGQPTIPYILKEGSFGSIYKNVYAEAPIGEMEGLRSLDNGKASCKFDTYLVFSLREGMEMYFNGHLDDVGPNRDEGLPSDRRGVIRALVAYPGRLYAAVDAGDDQDAYSSVLCLTKNGGWHEVYRAPGGKRIRNLYIQALPNTEYQRLWISEEEDLVWIPISLNPRKTTGYTYVSSGTLVTAWMYSSLYDNLKYYSGITLFTENCSANRTVLVEYQTDDEDDDDAWHTIGTVDSSPIEELAIGSYNVSGRRIRFRLTLTTASSSLTPIVKSFLVDTVIRLPVKNAWTVTAIVEDYGVDRVGEKETTTASSIRTQMNTWANSDSTPCPLTLHSVFGLFDNKRVFVEPGTIQVVEAVVDASRKVKTKVTFTLMEA